MGYLSWAIFGLIVGAIAKTLMPGKDPGGWIITLLLGVTGALVGGFLAEKLGFETKVGWGIGYLFSAILGSILLLAAYRLFSKSKQ